MADSVDPRRVRTRAALVAAAQTLLVQDRTNVSVLEITRLAGVGLGSYYNHFDSKESLFASAIDNVLEMHGLLMDRVTEAIDDPAEVFARAFRLTGRFHRLIPSASQVLLRRGLELITAPHGLAPRAMRDIENAVAAGRFSVTDPELAYVATAGASLALGQLLHAQPDRDAADAADQLAADLLRMFGIPEDEAEEICARPLPDLDELMAVALADSGQMS
ncbi:TetR/AcrR family transcriptional regulator [Gordonia sp. TBRC 11910]|uniref:TetR/AcrR family transcriptional regulator n=1 Tax=Gordonia asplenii TaxID=2725283 RepID=A0A848LAB8_9ACTN|nr:TetR/AcrR family transcriptional regulator [Gordonia asplenii]NMO04508.1 TetR/AcrR family transcriptional regulator [Gordonia asplenii]